MYCLISSVVGGVEVRPPLGDVCLLEAGENSFERKGGSLDSKVPRPAKSGRYRKYLVLQVTQVGYIGKGMGEQRKAINTQETETFNFSTFGLAS